MENKTDQMQESHNTLCIKSVETNMSEFDFEYGHDLGFCETTINYSIKMECPINGNVFREFSFKVNGESMDFLESQKNALQNMLDGKNISMRDDIPCSPYKIECKPSNKIHYLDVTAFCLEIQEMFRQLFDPSTWHFELKTIENE